MRSMQQDHLNTLLGVDAPALVHAVVVAAAAHQLKNAILTPMVTKISGINLL